MRIRFTAIFFSLLLVLAGAAMAAAQDFPEASSRGGKPRAQEDLPKGIKETLEKQKLEQEKKDFEEMLKRGEEAAKLSEEINASFEKNNNLSGEDQKKIDRLEKLVKKIRDDLGGEDDEEENTKDRPADLVNVLKSVQENASNLFAALKKTTRLTISAAAIESSNTVLKLLRFIRFRRN